MRVLVVACLLLTGCFQSRKDTTENVVHRDHFTIDGSVALPSGGALPIHLNITHDGTDRTSSHEEKQSSIDSAAIGREISAAFAPVMSALGGAAFPWSGAVQAASGVVGSLGIGYLAHKKRQQMKGGRT